MGVFHRQNLSCVLRWKEGGGRGEGGGSSPGRFSFSSVQFQPSPLPGIRERTGWRSLALGFHRKLNQLPSLITNPRFLIKGSLIKGRAQLCQCSDLAQGALGASEEPTSVLLRGRVMDGLPAAAGVGAWRFRTAGVMTERCRPADAQRLLAQLERPWSRLAI